MVNDENATIGMLLKSYNEYKAKFTAAEKKIESEKNNSEAVADARLEARKNIQLALGIVLKMKKKFESSVLEDAAFKEDVDNCKLQIELLEKKLELLGSPMSGIPATSFDDVAGLENVKTAVKDYLFALKNPELAKTYKIETNIGLLLYGPPGTGKTLVAEAIAHELGVRFFIITPSHVFGSFVGESERNIREIFAELRACVDGAVLLVDECESIFGKRTSDSNRAAIGVANQLLQEMNGATDSGNEKRVIIGATNRPELIDEAYLRYKRFSLHFHVGMPDIKAIDTLLNIKLAKLPCNPDLKDAMRRKLSVGYTCADVSNIIAQCSSLALREHRKLMELGHEVKVVNISVAHFNEVMKTFNPSVTEKDLEQYAAFEKRSKNSK